MELYEFIKRLPVCHFFFSSSPLIALSVLIQFYQFLSFILISHKFEHFTTNARDKGVLYSVFHLIYLFCCCTVIYGIYEINVGVLNLILFCVYKQYLILKVSLV